MNPRHVHLATITMVLLAALPALATDIHLKNGNIITGTIVDKDDPAAITLKTDVGLVDIQRADIARIVEKDTPLEHFRKQAEKLQPGDIEGRMKLAQFCSTNGLQIQAADLYRQVIEIKPGHADASRKLLSLLDRPARLLLRAGNRLFEQKQYADARDKYLQIVQFYAETPYARDAEHLIGETYYREGDLDDALMQWRSVLKRDARRVDCYQGILKVAEQKHEWANSARIIQGILSFTKDEQIRSELSAKLTLIRLLDQQQKTIEDNPGDAGAHLAMGKLLSRLGQSDMARRELEIATGLGAYNAEAFKILAQHYEETLNIFKAIRYWRLALEADPGGSIGKLAMERLPRLELLALIPEYFASRDARDRRDIVEKLEASEIPFQVIEAVARQGRVLEEQPTGTLDATVTLTGENVATDYSFFVPQSYRPDTPLPVILALHGDDASGANYVYLWIEQAEKLGYIIVAPTAIDGNWSEISEKAALKALRTVQSKYNVDPNRIYVSGNSIGAEAAWLMGMRYPHLFASVVSRSGQVGLLDQFYLPNLFHVPVYIVHGGLDFTFPAEEMRATRRQLRLLGIEHRYQEYRKGRHSPFIDENDSIIDWLADKRRPAYPDQIVMWTRQMDWNRAYWFQIEAFQGTIFHPTDEVVLPKGTEDAITPEQAENYFMASAKDGLASVAATMQDNSFNIRTKHIKGYTLLLNDSLVDMDEPVEVRTTLAEGSASGKRIINFKGKVERDVGFMLEWIRRTQDTSQVFSAYLRIIGDKPQQ